MKPRTLCFVCASLIVTLLAGCAAVYQNTSACEDAMRAQLASKADGEQFAVTHAGTAIYGSRVVVEGTLTHLSTPASAVVAASAAEAAQAASAAAAASEASPAHVARNAPQVQAAAASAAQAASAAVIEAASKPKKVVVATAAECTFNEKALTAFKWLAPSKFLDSASDEDGAEKPE